MPLAFSVLGSGSSGNCTLLRLRDGAGWRNMLIDAGLSPRQTRHRLAPLGVDLSEITDLLLTHLDSDHFRPTWSGVVDRQDVRVHIHQGHRRQALAAGLPLRRLSPFSRSPALGDSTPAESVLLAHDQSGSVGYLIEHDGCRLGFATDLGRVTPALLERFGDVHALALESNYDRQMQLDADRPDFVKSRVMGGLGHLSNEQALDAVVRLDARSALSHVVLLHLSRQCNDPELVRRLYAEHAPHVLPRLTIASQVEATPLLQVGKDAEHRRESTKHKAQSTNRT